MEAQKYVGVPDGTNRNTLLGLVRREEKRDLDKVEGRRDGQNRVGRRASSCLDQWPGLSGS